MIAGRSAPGTVQSKKCVKSASTRVCGFFVCVCFGCEGLSDHIAFAPASGRGYVVRQCFAQVTKRSRALRKRRNCWPTSVRSRFATIATTAATTPMEVHRQEEEEQLVQQHRQQQQVVISQCRPLIRSARARMARRAGRTKDGRLGWVAVGRCGASVRARERSAN